MPVTSMTLPAALAAAVLTWAASPASTAGEPSASAPEDHRQARREARVALKAGDFDAPTMAWREGPVRYILTAAEDHEFRRLRSHEERAAFIAKFWDGRDPDLATPENEYRALFEARVAA